ncbi:MAG TPA: CDP-alcohol phosphatidyltransferase family protein [Anaerolineae bacterium]|nr:CDP-alcohol phosphatidyltransferase family protein [Anaerolineae bacterium]
MSEQAPKSQSFTESLRPKVEGVLQPIGRGLIRLGLSADAITIGGTLLMAIVGVLLANGQFFLGGALVILSAPLDALDGTVARLAGVTSKFGAFLDSTSDRYAEGFILIGLLIYGLTRRDDWIVVLSFVAMWGSFVVSYTRARAEGLGYKCKIGLLTRLERFLLIIVMLLTGLILPGLIVLAALTHVTALQRILFVRRATRTGSLNAGT